MTHRTWKKNDPAIDRLFASFKELFGLGCTEFRPPNKPVKGWCDGNKGVQWNIAHWTDIAEIHLGVNLEGISYSSWPIATFILAELENPCIEMIKSQLKHLERVIVRFCRDAWRYSVRENIKEMYLGGRDIPILEVTPKLWVSLLKDALDCLDKEKGYRGRNIQSVTLVKGNRRTDMEVSPHLTIYTPILPGDNLENGKSLLEPVRDWIAGIIHN